MRAKWCTLYLQCHISSSPQPLEVGADMNPILLMKKLTIMGVCYSTCVCPRTCVPVPLGVLCVS